MYVPQADPEPVHSLLQRALQKPQALLVPLTRLPSLETRRTITRPDSPSVDHLAVLGTWVFNTWPPGHTSVFAEPSNKNLKNENVGCMHYRVSHEGSHQET